MCEKPKTADELRWENRILHEEMRALRDDRCLAWVIAAVFFVLGCAALVLEGRT